MATIFIATRNPHKVQEIRAILGSQFHFLTLNDFPGAPKVIEDADTFAGNAAKKAVELAQWLAARDFDQNDSPSPQPSAVHPPQCYGGRARRGRIFVLADDSGLEVDALDGAPGVLSARFAALGANENSPDKDNNAKLLRVLKEVPADKRTARFRCALALAPVSLHEAENASPVCYAEEPELQTQLFDGVCEGRILFEPRGNNGFGYDPLFVPTGLEMTYAELGDEVKNQLSHRAKALEKLKTFLCQRTKGN